jgi:hypothetical protein
LLLLQLSQKMSQPVSSYLITNKRFISSQNEICLFKKTTQFHQQQQKLNNESYMSNISDHNNTVTSQKYNDPNKKPSLEQLVKLQDEIVQYVNIK